MFKDISNQRVNDRRSQMKYNKETINLSIADSDFATPSFITSDIAKAIIKGDFAYWNDKKDLAKTINNYLKHQNNLGSLEANNFFFSIGVIPILQAAINLHTTKNDYVLILNPIYGPFIKIVNLMGRKVIFCNVVDGKIDFARLSADIRKYQIKLLLFCNPHNPTGKIFKLKELQKIYNLIQANKGYIYCDEVWSDLVLGNKFIPFASIDQTKESHIVTINGLGKGFILQALRFGYAYSFNQKLITDLTTKSRQCNYPLHQDVATVAALKSAYSKAGYDWLQKYNQLIYQNFKLVKKALTKTKIIVPSIEATHVLLLDFKDIPKTHEEISLLLKNTNIILSDGLDFGPLGHKKFRLNLSTTSKTLDILMKKLQEISEFN